MWVRWDEHPCSNNIPERFITVPEVRGADEESVLVTNSKRNYTKKERNRCVQIRGFLTSLIGVLYCIYKLIKKTRLPLKTNRKNNHRSHKPRKQATGSYRWRAAIHSYPASSTWQSCRHQILHTCLRSEPKRWHDYGRKALSSSSHTRRFPTIANLCLGPPYRMYGEYDRLIWPRTWQPGQEPEE